MLKIEKPQNRESALSANSSALRLSGWLMNYGYLKLFYIYQNLPFTFWTKYREILNNCIFSYFIPCLLSTDRAFNPFYLHIVILLLHSNIL